MYHVLACMTCILLCYAVYFGRQAPIWEDLGKLRNEKTHQEFNLLEKLEPSWRKVGEKLGMDLDEISGIEEQPQIYAVLEKWFESWDQLPNKELYPLTWKGLHKLLKDSGNRKLADKYFKFLQDKIELYT